MAQDSSKTRSIWNIMQGEGTAADRANTAALNRWSIVWALGLIAASWAVKVVGLPDAAKWAVALAPNLIALMVLRRYLTFLRMTDELLRRIHLEGLAVAFGATYMFVIGYFVAQGAGAPPLDLAYLVLVMTAAWLLGNVAALKRYR